MNISLNNVGRRFNKEWIFKGINMEFLPRQRYAILGPNGSGKSTLISILTGSLTPSEGKISYAIGDREMPIEEVYRSISLAAPYLELVETFTLKETIDYHFKFKSFAEGLNTSLLISLLGMEKSAHKQIRYFSSGMKQRTKLALACCADSPVLFLDEPTSNLDLQGVEWYLSLMEKFTKSRLTIIGSNQSHEYEFCENRMQMADFK